MPDDEDRIRYLGDMERLQVMPGDKFVIRYDGPISREQAERIRADVRAFLGPEAKCLVLSSGLRFGVIGFDTQDNTK